VQSGRSTGGKGRNITAKRCGLPCITLGVGAKPWNKDELAAHPYVTELRDGDARQGLNFLFYLIIHLCADMRLFKEMNDLGKICLCRILCHDEYVANLTRSRECCCVTIWSSCSHNCASAKGQWCSEAEDIYGPEETTWKSTTGFIITTMYKLQIKEMKTCYRTLIQTVILSKIGNQWNLPK